MKHLEPIKIFRCQHCGSSNLKIIINGVAIDPKKPNIPNIKKQLKKVDFCIWECYGRCDDETSASMTVDGKMYDDPIDVLEYLSGSKVKISIKKAIEIGDVAILKEYIDGGNSVDSYIRDTPGLTDYELNSSADKDDTLLCFAVKQTRFNIVEFLVNSGCDVNKKSDRNDSYNFTPLMWSIGELTINARQRAERTKILDILLENGADPYITDNRGKNSFDWIIKDRNKDNCENFGYRKKLVEYVKEKTNNQ